MTVSSSADGPCVDLHTHTTASDGLDTPEALIANAVAAGLAAVAITDHDSVSAIDAAHQATQGTSLTLVPGIELSTESNNADLHILGYFVDPHSEELLSTLTWLVEKRLERVTLICEKLQNAGYLVPLDEVLDLAGTGTVGRPHVARVMMEREYVSSVGQAFGQFLGRGKPAYVTAEKLQPEQAIKLILKSGGVPVLAHPHSTRDPERVVPQLKSYGLLGLEVWYGEYDRVTRERFADLASRNELIATGGSDYHGLAIKPNRPLGVPCVDAAVVSRLETAAASRNS